MVWVQARSSPTASIFRQRGVVHFLLGIGVFLQMLQWISELEMLQVDPGAKNSTWCGLRWRWPILCKFCEVKRRLVCAITNNLGVNLIK